MIDALVGMVGNAMQSIASTASRALRAEADYLADTVYDAILSGFQDGIQAARKAAIAIGLGLFSVMLGISLGMAGFVKLMEHAIGIPGVGYIAGGLLALAIGLVALYVSGSVPEARGRRTRAA